MTITLSLPTAWQIFLWLTVLSYIITGAISFQFFYGFSGKFWESLGTSLFTGFFNMFTLVLAAITLVVWAVANVNIVFK